MLAMGIPLKDGKHVIGYYEFSKPVQGVKTRAYLLEFSVSNTEKRLTTKTITTNGEVTPLSSCKHECTSDADCGYFADCVSYCCDYNWGNAISCCLSAGYCELPCSKGWKYCVSCVVVNCVWCLASSCEEEGTQCEYLSPGP